MTDRPPPKPAPCNRECECLLNQCTRHLHLFGAGSSYYCTDPDCPDLKRTARRRQ